MEFLFQQLSHSLAVKDAGSFIMAIVLAYMGGILSSFTPCIYPMIPITIGFIGGASERSIKDGWLLSSFYVLGMATVYAILGVLASLTGQIFGTMTNSPGWYLFLGAIMAICSLWMLDVIKFDPNVWLENAKRRRGRSKSHARGTEEERASAFSAYVFGASSGFLAAPCTTPVLTTILTYIATERSVAYGTVLMFSFAMGLGTILVVVGTFTGALKLMPKSGKWLQRVKVFSGLLILILGGYFVFKAGKLS